MKTTTKQTKSKALKLKTNVKAGDGIGGALAGAAKAGVKGGAGSDSGGGLLKTLGDHFLKNMVIKTK
jgi:hypothetical protein